MDTVTNLLKGNLAKFKESVELMILEKISEKLEERKTEIAQGIFYEENINEISDGLKYRYMMAAKADADNLERAGTKRAIKGAKIEAGLESPAPFDTQENGVKSYRKLALKNFQKAKQRKDGIETASKGSAVLGDVKAAMDDYDVNQSVGKARVTRGAEIEAGLASPSPFATQEDGVKSYRKLAKMNFQKAKERKDEIDSAGKNLK